jgi:hypothetical protein
MFNDPLIHEEARLKIAEREQEAEAHRLYKQLGYGDRGARRWLFVFIILVIALIFVTILL